MQMPSEIVSVQYSTVQYRHRCCLSEEKASRGERFRVSTERGGFGLAGRGIVLRSWSVSRPYVPCAAGAARCCGRLAGVSTLFRWSLNGCVLSAGRERYPHSGQGGGPGQ